MSVIKKKFGKQLKIIRKLKNLTQESLAEKIGINLRQLARIEAGESFITAETLYKICSVLEISPRTLFDFNINESEDGLMLFNVIENNTHIFEKYKSLKSFIESIIDDEKKIEYMTLAFNSLQDKNSLKELKVLIKGIELTQM